MKNVLDEDIKKGEFSTVYLLYGEEEFLKQSYKKQLRSAIAGDDTILVICSDKNSATELAKKLREI